MRVNEILLSMMQTETKNGDTFPPYFAFASKFSIKNSSCGIFGFYGVTNDFIIGKLPLAATCRSNRADSRVFFFPVRSPQLFFPPQSTWKQFKHRRHTLIAKYVFSFSSSMPRREGKKKRVPSESKRKMTEQMENEIDRRTCHKIIECTESLSVEQFHRHENEMTNLKRWIRTITHSTPITLQRDTIVSRSSILPTAIKVSSISLWIHFHIDTNRCRLLPMARRMMDTMCGKNFKCLKKNDYAKVAQNWGEKSQIKGFLLSMNEWNEHWKHFPHTDRNYWMIYRNNFEMSALNCR